MSDANFIFIGWVKDLNENTDKVWTAFSVGSSYYAAWGRRGKKLCFKKHSSSYALSMKIREQKKKYKEVDEFQLFACFPNFKEELQKQFLFKNLSGDIK